MPTNSISSRYGLARLPVVLVAHDDRAHAGLEFLELVRAGADAGVEVGGAVLDDVEVEGAEDHRQVGVRRASARIVTSFGPVALTSSIWSASTLAFDAVAGSLWRISEIHHVGRRRAACRRGRCTPLRSLNDPGLGVLGGERLGQRGLRRQAAVQRGQAVVEHDAARVVGLVATAWPDRACRSRRRSRRRRGCGRPCFGVCACA